MVRNIIKFLIPLVLLTSCERLKESSSLITGNQQFRSGEYQESIISYLNGIESREYKDYFYYNLGNVYSHLGEYQAAFSVWSYTDGGSNNQLKFNLLYNKGYLEYQLGNYESAYDLFKQALILSPTDIEAKINLELSLSKMSAASYSQPTDAIPRNSEELSESDETTRILEYVKQKEELLWGTTYQEQEEENDW